jgi:hypothetical protein
MRGPSYRLLQPTPKHPCFIEIISFWFLFLILFILSGLMNTQNNLCYNSLHFPLIWTGSTVRLQNLVSQFEGGAQTEGFWEQSVEEDIWT